MPDGERRALDTHQGAFTAFPFTVPLAAAVFVVMLQLTFVCAKWPFDGLGRVPSGFAALALSWVVGTAGYFLLINWNSVPAAARAAIGLRSGMGPMDALDFVGLLLCVVMWQVVLFILFDGRPFARIPDGAPRQHGDDVGELPLVLQNSATPAATGGQRPRRPCHDGVATTVLGACACPPPRRAIAFSISARPSCRRRSGMTSGGRKRSTLP